MPETLYTAVDDVVRQCGGDLVDIVVPDLDSGGVFVVCGGRSMLVSIDDLPELNRRGIFQSFVVDYLRARLLL